jgi:hypothetical protein
MAIMADQLCGRHDEEEDFPLKATRFLGVTALGALKLFMDLFSLDISNSRKVSSLSLPVGWGSRPEPINFNSAV